MSCDGVGMRVLPVVRVFGRRWGERMTNFERIKAMSVEEMAKCLCEMMTAECCDFSCPAREYCTPHNNGLPRWLESEVQDG